MKKLFFLILIVVSMVTSVYAKTDTDFDESKLIKFDEIYYEDDLLKENDNVEVEYIKDGNKQIANIRDIDNGEVLETITLEKLEPMSFYSAGNFSYDSHIHPYVLTKDNNHNGLKVRLSVNVDFYSNGSFREVHSIRGYDLHILNPITRFDFENKNLDVWSNKPLPTNELSFAYHTTVKATVQRNIGGSVSAQLKNIGFSLSGSTSEIEYYRKYIENAGKIYIR